MSRAKRIYNQEVGLTKGDALKIPQKQTKTGKAAAGDRYHAAQMEEDALIEFIDFKRAIRHLAPIMEKLQKRKMSVRDAFEEISSAAFMETAKLMFSESTSEKVKADLLKYVLGVSGHVPSQKIEVGRLDPSMPKEALISLIAGARKDLEKENIDIIDDREDEPEQG